MKASSGIVLCLLLVFGGSMAASAQASGSPTGAMRFLRARNEQLTRLLRQRPQKAPAQAQRCDRLRVLINRLLDYEELSRRALRDHWENHSEAERNEFVGILTKLVERNYQGNLERVLEFRISYEDESRRGDLALVRTEARARGRGRQPPVSISYAMRPLDGGWAVVDVTTDGVSMVSNYRQQFNRIIEKHSWSELLDRMRRRLARQEAENPCAGERTSSP